MTNPKNKPSTTNRHLRRLERMVVRLLKVDFDDAEEFWQMQIDLLRLQQDLQEAIAVHKGDPVLNADELSVLRWTRHNARRFGDVIAWVAMNADRKQIFPLAAGSSVPVPARDATTEGMLRLAKDMWTQGWGFPVLHDVTNCLRLGDITFVNTEYDTMNTVEVKSRRIGPICDNQAEFAFTAHFAGRPTLDSSQLEKSKRLGYRVPARLNKQLRKMNDARQHQVADSGLSRDSSGDFITVNLTDIEGDYFNELGSLCRRARRHGYSDAVIDGFVCYAVYYNPDRISEADINNSRMLATITDQLVGTKRVSGDTRESLLLRSIPSDYSHTEAELALPYLLFPLPRATILDLLNRRMTVVAIVNLGVLLGALKPLGIDAEVKPRTGNLLPEIVLTSHAEDTKYGTYQVDYHGVETLILEGILDFRSLDYLTKAFVSAFDQIKLNARSAREGGPDRKQVTR